MGESVGASESPQLPTSQSKALLKSWSWYLYSVKTEKEACLFQRLLLVQDKNNPTRPAGVSQTERRFVKFGGGLSERQILWLREECQAARCHRQRVIIFGHLPVHPDTCYNACLLWNYDRVLDIVHEYKDVCVATFTGHAHNVSQSLMLYIRPFTVSCLSSLKKALCIPLNQRCKRLWRSLDCLKRLISHLREAF